MTKKQPSAPVEPAIPRSIRVTDKRWARWEARAAALGLTISAWLHLLAEKDCRKK